MPAVEGADAGGSDACLQGGGEHIAGQAGVFADEDGAVGGRWRGFWRRRSLI